MIRAKVIALVVLLWAWITPALGYNLSVTASGGSGAWSAGTYTIAVGAEVSFACTPSGGSAPYAYSWNFDDLDTYKDGVSTSQNPTHTFDWPGVHYVWVTVTDDGSNEEKAFLKIHVEDSLTELDAITDGGLTDDNSTDNTSALQTLIDADGDGQYRVTFRKTDTGVYKFVSTTTIGAYTVAINFATDAKVELVGEPGVILKFAPSSSVESFYYYTNNSATRYIIFRNMGIQYVDPGADPSCDMFDPSQETGTKYHMFENIDFQNIRKMGISSRDIVKRCNYDEWGSGNGNLNYSYTNSFWRHNYVHGGISEHSHIFYNREHNYIYYIENYLDAENAGSAKLGLQLKPGNDDANQQYQQVIGNIIKNTPSYGLVVGRSGMEAAGGVVSNVKIDDNRFVNVDSNNAIQFRQSNSGNSVSRNHFNDIAPDVIQIGVTGNAIDGMTNDDNVAGYLAGSDAGQSFIVCGAAVCNYDSQSGNVENTTKYVSTDPSGWYDADGYLDPGEWEYIIPTIGSARASGKTLDSISMGTNGSGMGAGEANARFPFTVGAIIQAEDGSNNYSEVIDFSTTPAYSFSGLSVVDGVRVADVDRNWSSLYEDLSGVSITGSFEISGCVIQ